MEEPLDCLLEVEGSGMVVTLDSLAAAGSLAAAAVAAAVAAAAALHLAIAFAGSLFALYDR